MSELELGIDVRRMNMGGDVFGGVGVRASSKHCTKNVPDSPCSIVGEASLSVASFNDSGSSNGSRNNNNNSNVMDENAAGAAAAGVVAGVGVGAGAGVATTGNRLLTTAEMVGTGNNIDTIGGGQISASHTQQGTGPMPSPAAAGMTPVAARESQLRIVVDQGLQQSGGEAGGGGGSATAGNSSTPGM